MIFGAMVNTFLKLRRCIKHMVRHPNSAEQDLRSGMSYLTSNAIDPIFGVNPEELSTHDADTYNHIYVSESKRRIDNYDIFCKGIDFDGALTEPIRKYRSRS